MRELFLLAKRSIDFFFDQVNVRDVELLLEAMLGCSGSIVLSGVGKSGLIAQKIAATLISTGTCARYLPCVDALHGDIGVVSPKDLFIAISKSGESEELLALIPFIEQRGAKTVALVSKIDSRLARKCSMNVLLPVDRELCPLDLAPTTSTQIQLILGDVLAVALMRAKKISVADFALNHPAGLLGKKITLKVKDVMLQGADVPFCYSTDRLVDVLHELSSKKCGSLIIVDENQRLQGIFTDGDLRRAIQSRGFSALETCIADVMTRAPKIVQAEQLAAEAMRVMEEDPARPVSVLPVVSDDRVVGVLRMHDILNQKVLK